MVSVLNKQNNYFMAVVWLMVEALLVLALRLGCYGSLSDSIMVNKVWLIDCTYLHVVNTLWGFTIVLMVQAVNL